MNTYSLRPLEFDRLLEVIASTANSDISRHAVLTITPFQTKGDIVKRQQQIREIMQLSSLGDPLRLQPFRDISPMLLKARPEGSVLDAAELASFIPVFSIAAGIDTQLGIKEGIPSLSELAAGLNGFPELLKQLKRSVNSEGEILDSASRLLSDIRDRIRKLEAKIRKKLEEMVRDKDVAIFLQDDFITKRSGRWVVPVRMDSKGQIAGVVHDVSNSGETAFIEPLATISLTNELENLIAEQKTEEIRILRALTAGIRADAGEIESQFKTIVQLDMLSCISLFAERHRMSVPGISDTNCVHIVQARHPLLLLALGKTGRGGSLVPLDISLGTDSTVMVITGSNAGGKTISIKTVGLLALMALSGMPVPADEASSFPLINSIVVDIGDDQSIESSLSTFSAHISNITRIIDQADQRTLVLIDELGTGTDPAEGGALACAILKELREKGSLVFATTHLADIKGFVHRTGGMLNASMEFDQRTLLPLYRLRLGEPGQSYAIETAKRYGLPQRIVDSAKTLLGSNKIEFDNLVSDLNEKRRQNEEAIAGLAQMKKELCDSQSKVEEERRTSQLEYKKALAEAYEKAAGIVSETKKQMNELLDEIKKTDKEDIKKRLREAGEKQKVLTSKKQEFMTAQDRPDGLSVEAIQEGDSVHVISLGRDALVTQVNKAQGRIKVQSGGVEIELPASALAPAKGSTVPFKGMVTAPPSADAAASRINLVGQRVDEAIENLEPFLNHASLSSINEVIIIHGFGTGRLGRGIREHLKGHPLVKKFRSGEQSEGGGGVTVATLA